MAAKGITIEIGAKTTQLESSIKAITAKSRELSTQLRVVQNDLKLDAGDRLVKLADGLKLAEEKAKLASDNVKKLKESIQENNKQLDAAKQAVIEHTKAVVDNEKILAKQKDVQSGISKEMERLKKAISDNKAAYKEGTTSAEKYKYMQEQLTGKLERAKAANEKFKEAVSQVSKSLKESKDALVGSEKATEHYSQKQEKLKNELGKAERSQRLANNEVADWKTKAEQGAKSTNTLSSAMNSVEKNTKEAASSGNKFWKSFLVSTAAGTAVNILHGIANAIANIAKAAWNATKAIVSFAWNGIKNITKAGVEYGKEAIALAASTQELASTTNRIFGSSSEQIKKWAEASARNIGLSKNEALGYINLMGSLLKNKGLSESDAAEWAIALSQRAADVGAALDFGTDEVVTKIQAMIRGEYTSIDSIGVILNKTKVTARAVQDYLKEHKTTIVGFEHAMLKYENTQLAVNDAVAKYGANSDEAIEANELLQKHERELNSVMHDVAKNFTDAELTLAGLNMTMEQTADVSGTFKEEAKGWNGLMKIMAAESTNLKNKIGDALLPVATTVLGKLDEIQNRPEVAEMIKRIEKSIGLLGEKIIQFVNSETFDQWIQDVLESANGLIAGVTDFVTSDSFSNFFSAGASGMTNAISAIKDFVASGGVSNFFNKQLPDFFDKITGMLSNIDKILDAAIKIHNSINPKGAIYTKEDTQSGRKRQDSIKVAKSMAKEMEGFDVTPEQIEKVLKDYAKKKGLALDAIMMNWDHHEKIIRGDFDKLKESLSENADETVEEYMQAGVAYRNALGQMKKLSKTLGSDVDGVEAIVKSYSRENKIALEEIYKNWEYYEPNIISHMVKMKNGTIELSKALEDKLAGGALLPLKSVSKDMQTIAEEYNKFISSIYRENEIFGEADIDNADKALAKYAKSMGLTIEELQEYHAIFANEIEQVVINSKNGINEIKTEVGESLKKMAADTKTSFGDVMAQYNAWLTSTDKNSTGVLAAIGKFTADNNLKVTDIIGQFEKMAKDSGMETDKIPQKLTALSEDVRAIDTSGIKAWADKNLSELERVNLGIDATKRKLSTLAYDQKYDQMYDYVHHRASGGTVRAGQPYIVGEKGQEMFVPRFDGRILNHQQTQTIINNHYAAQSQAPVDMREMVSDLIANITLKLDNEVIFDGQEKVRRRRGKSLIAGVNA